MKKIMIFAAAVAALAACSKEAETVVDANHFEKGQKVTLTVKAGEPSTRVSSELNSSTGGIDFKWQANDVIKVTVNGQSKEFTLIGDGGSNEGKFEGEMPDGGSTFSVQYPYDDPEIADQTYPSSEALPHDKMLFTDENCQLSEMTFELQAQYAALRLNLWGASQTISKIVVTNTTSSATYTLTMDPAVELPTTEAAAQAFFIVVPAGEEDWNFTAEIYDNAAIPAKICEFSPSAAQTFENGKFLNMPAKEVKKEVIHEYVHLGLSVKWATCNIGADSPEEYGTYFAWGDVVGQTWNGSSWSGGGFSSYPEYELDANNNLKPEYDAAHIKWGSPWRMPTKAECQELIDNCTSTWTSDYNGTGIAGRIFTSNKEGYTDKSIFLPAAGYGYDSNLPDAGSMGYCWSSTFYSGDFAGRLYFYSVSVSTTNYRRSRGFSVRPVTE